MLDPIKASGRPVTATVGGGVVDEVDGDVVVSLCETPEVRKHMNKSIDTQHILRIY